jgi:hypothetical protein
VRPKLGQWLGPLVHSTGFVLRLFVNFHLLHTENNTTNYAAVVVVVVVRQLLTRQFSFCWSYSPYLFVFENLPAGDDTKHISLFSHYERCCAAVVGGNTWRCRRLGQGKQRKQPKEAPRFPSPVPLAQVSRGWRLLRFSLRRAAAIGPQTFGLPIVTTFALLRTS